MYSLHPSLSMFTQLPPEGSFSALKAARLELETVVTRHKEREDDAE